MKPHFHAGIEHVLLYGISAVIFIDVMGIVASKLAARPGVIGNLGKSLGAVIPFAG
jgi:hypothetical protein